MEVRQAKLQSGNRHTTCWIDADIKVNSKIRFKDQKEFWDVKQLYNTVIEKKELNSDWKVGGI